MIKGEHMANSFASASTTDADDLYKAVKMDTGSLDNDPDVAICGAGEDAVGILDTFATAGNAVRVVHTGLTKARVGAAVSVNARLKTDSNGKLIPVTSNNDKFVAQAITAATAEDQIILVRLVAGGTHGV